MWDSRQPEGLTVAARFAIFPPEIAYERRVLFAVELLDPVALVPVTDGFTVSATGLVGKPTVNPSGQFVWLTEGNAVPQRVVADPGSLRYEREDLAVVVPVDRLVRITLRPKRGYAVPSGVAAIASSLYESMADPPVSVRGANVWLRWIDDNTGTTVDALPATATGDDGGFVAFIRFAPADTPRLDGGGRLRARLRVDRAGTIRDSQELQLPQGRTTDLAPFIWDQL